MSKPAVEVIKRTRANLRWRTPESRRPMAYVAIERADALTLVREFARLNGKRGRRRA
jgi:hypothetical protein